MQKLQTRVVLTLAMGFILGLGLASCASQESHRSVASDGAPRFASGSERREEKIQCQVGEVKNESGACERPYTFDRPYRRGGR